MEGSLVAYKVFTNGSVLQASEINDNLMRQSVMVFSNSAARSAAITVPLEGMLSWLQDTNKYEYYSGSAWVELVPPTGLTLVKSQAVGTGVSSITVNDAFNTDFDAYKIIATGGTGSAAFFSLRLGAANTQYYQIAGGFVYSTGNANNGNTNNGTQFTVAARSDSDYIGLNLDIINPFLAKTTSVSGFDAGTISAGYVSGVQRSNTSFTSFTLNISTGSVTGGTIFVYGYRKS